MAYVCDSCGKGINIQAFSRHKKGKSGGGGVWALRAQITKKTQKPNLHKFQGMKLCTKCLRTLKKALGLKQVNSAAQPTPTLS